MRGKFTKDYWIIRVSGLFDPVYYIRTNPDVRRADMDPLEHFVLYGWKEGRNPNEWFDVKKYLESHPELRERNINPLTHYIFTFVSRSNLKKLWFYIRLLGVRGTIRKVVEKLRTNYSNISVDVDSGLRFKLRDFLLILNEDSVRKVQNLKVDRPIDILIPVYNGYDFLEPLFRSIVRNTTLPYRLLICDDCSSDRRVFEYLKVFKEENPGIDIILERNSENLGFVKTVNRLAEMTESHFIILNTDVIVPPFWIERLIYPFYRLKNVASVTPFSNSATICSFPDFCRDNPLYLGLSVDEIDYYFSFVNFENTYIEIPTAVGFCMAINREVYEKIGLFDEEFGKGYGEENDWCMRARKMGYRHILATNLFVYHRHGGSFTDTDERELLRRRGLERVLKKHPEYLYLVESFIKSDPVKRVRFTVKTKILSDRFGPVLVLDHALGGGANYFREELIKDREIYFLLTPGYGNSKDSRVKVIVYGKELDEKGVIEIEDYREIEGLVRQFGLSSLHINNLYSFPEVLKLIETVLEIFKKYKIPVFYYLHDYFCICPSPHLINNELDFCGIPDDKTVCQRCIESNYLYVSDAYKKYNIEEWRDYFGKLLSASNIVYFSESSINIIRKIYDISSEKTILRPHRVDYMRKVRVDYRDRKLRIGIIGMIGIHKGSYVVRKLVEYINDKNLPVEIYIIGEIYEPEKKLTKLQKVFIHGRYRRDQLPDILEKYKINFIFFPSIWPETFSFVTEEVMMMGLPVAVFDIGAPAERVKFYEKGLLIEFSKRYDPEYIYSKINAFWNSIQIKDDQEHTVNT